MTDVLSAVRLKIAAKKNPPMNKIPKNLAQLIDFNLLIKSSNARAIIIITMIIKSSFIVYNLTWRDLSTCE